MELVEYRIHHNQEFLIYKEGKSSVQTIIQDLTGHYAGIRQKSYYGAACVRTDSRDVSVSDRLIRAAAKNAGNQTDFFCPLSGQSVPAFSEDILTDLEKYREILEQIFCKNRVPDRCRLYLELRGSLAEKRILSGYNQFKETDYHKIYFSVQISDMENLQNTVSHTFPYNKRVDIGAMIHQLSESVIWNREHGIRTCNPGFYECILHPEATALMIHEAIGHAMEADIAFGDGNRARKTFPIVNEKITVVDFANRAFGKETPVPVYIDDEGTKCEDVELIKNGQPGRYMNNRWYAERFFGGACTGNARAYFYRDSPLIRMRNTVLLPGRHPREDMFASVRDGYYLTKVENGQADTGGRFTFRIAEGYRIKNGKLLYAVRGNSVVGDIFGFLNNITDLSAEFQWLEGRLCSKKQVVPVGMGGPYVQCRLFLL